MSASKCPFAATHPHTTGAARTNRDWWPNQLNLGMLHQNPPAGNPLGGDFDYAEAFRGLDLDADRFDLR